MVFTFITGNLKFCMKSYFFTFIFFVFFYFITCGQSKIAYYDSLFNHYQKLNYEEERLLEYKDEDVALKQKIVQLELINNSRKKYRRNPLQLDILSCRLANKNSKEAAENAYTSHWNLNGETPYQKYAFAGGMDHVSENAYGIRTNKKFKINQEKIREFMREGHHSFMEERKPNDGHKKTIIEKPHNYVGIGYYMTEKQFNYYEIYIDRYLEFIAIPSQINANEAFQLIVKSPTDQYIFFVVVTMDDFPSPRSPAILNRKRTYNDYGKRKITSINPWDLAQMHHDKTYTLNLAFKKPGLYYIHIFLGKKELTKPDSFDTERLFQASGIVIKVVE